MVYCEITSLKLAFSEQLNYKVTQKYNVMLEQLDKYNELNEKLIKVIAQENINPLDIELLIEDYLGYEDQLLAVLKEFSILPSKNITSSMMENRNEINNSKITKAESDPSWLLDLPQPSAGDNFNIVTSKLNEGILDEEKNPLWYVDAEYCEDYEPYHSWEWPHREYFETDVLICTQK